MKTSLFLFFLMLNLSTVAFAGTFKARTDLRKVRLDAVPQGSSAYNPSQMRHAYGFDQISGNGAGQTIGIIDPYGSPTLQADLNYFSSSFGLAALTVQIVTPGGAPTTSDSGWAGETTVDVEWAHAIAPGAKIILCEAKSSSMGDLGACISYFSSNAKSMGIAQVSMSWGGSESSSQLQFDSEFNNVSVTFIASAGDSGTGAQWPAASAYVLSVGGTNLQLDSSGNILSETAWTDSGGGESQVVSIPAYQSSFQTSTQRGIPDVAYDADPSTGVMIYQAGSWYQVGGTSIGAPQWAGYLALINQNRSTQLGPINTALYGLVTPSTTSSDFNDVTSGCNGSGSQTVDCARAGYDFVTGLGSPKGNVIVAGFGAGSPSPSPSPSPAPSPAPTPTPSPTPAPTPAPSPTPTPSPAPAPAPAPAPSPAPAPTPTPPSSTPMRLKFVSTSGRIETTIGLLQNSSVEFVLEDLNNPTAKHNGNIAVYIDGRLALSAASGSTYGQLPLTLLLRGQNLTVGRHIITATFSDSKGNNGNAALTVQVSTNPPQQPQSPGYIF